MVIALLLCACASLPPFSADDYVLDAAEKIRATGYYADQVSWPETLAQARSMAGKARSPAEAHPAISFLLGALQDHHSFLIPPERRRAISSDERVDGFDLRAELVGDKGYVRVPHFVGTAAAREVAFAAQLRGNVTALQAQRPCGWIVDLRDDQGGNMDPMLAGLVDFLGTGDLGYFVAKEGRTPWSVRRFYEMTHEVQPSPQELTLVDANVAVLIGPRTMSSGEAVAIAFRGRPNTRFFGLPSAGLSSGNAGVVLSDGAMMLVTTALFADRTGSVYGHAMAPDETIAGSGTPSAPFLEEDAAILRASEWLDSQPACAAHEGRPAASPRPAPS